MACAVFSARRVPRSVLDGKRISEDSTGSIYCCWIRSSDVPDRKRGWNTTARNVNSCPSIPSTSCRRFALTKAVSLPAGERSRYPYENSFALYCIKELHFLMPVAVHPHGTLQVCLENVNAQRKKLITVGLCFFSVIHL